MKWCSYSKGLDTSSTSTKTQEFASLVFRKVGKDEAGGPALTHAGSNTMWYAVAWLAPKKDFAVVIACNQANDKACSDAVLALIANHFKGE